MGHSSPPRGQQPIWNFLEDASFLRPISSVSWLVCQLLFSNLWNSLSEIWNQSLKMEGKERWEEEVDHSRWVGGKLDKQGNLHLSLAGVAAEIRSLRPPTTVLQCMCLNVFSYSVVTDSLWPHRLQPTWLLCPWILYRDLNGVQSDISSRGSQKCITLSRLCLEVTWSGEAGRASLVALGGSPLTNAGDMASSPGLGRSPVPQSK